MRSGIKKTVQVFYRYCDRATQMRLEVERPRGIHGEIWEKLVIQTHLLYVVFT